MLSRSVGLCRHALRWSIAQVGVDNGGELLDTHDLMRNIVISIQISYSGFPLGDWIPLIRVCFGFGSAGRRSLGFLLTYLD